MGLFDRILGRRPAPPAEGGEELCTVLLPVEGPNWLKRLSSAPRSLQGLGMMPYPSYRWLFLDRMRPRG